MIVNRGRLLFSVAVGSLSVLTYAGTASAAGPIAYWNMDEAAGATAALDSVGPADAVASAAVDGNLPVAGVAGILGTAWSFDGSNDSVLNVAPPNQAAFTSLGLANGGFTYSGWINVAPGTAGGANTFFSISDAAAGSEEAVLAADNSVLRFLGRHNSLDNVDISSTATIDDGLWHHAAVTSGPTGTVLYLDGNPVNSSPYGVDIATFTANTNNIAVNFGANNDNAPNLQWEYPGLIDEFSVYDSVLSASDVAYLAANPGSVVPEPASLMLLAGAIGCVSLRRSRIC